MIEVSPLVTSLSFVDDLGFIASGTSVKEIARTLETVATTLLEWGTANAVIQIRGLTRTHGLVPGLVWQIQLAVVQSAALYGAELSWKSQKNHEGTIQQLFNRQARSIRGMYPSTPIHPLLCQAGLTPASTVLDYRQKLYAYRLLSLPDQHPTKEILPISLREGDGAFQPRTTILCGFKMLDPPCMDNGQLGR